MGKIMTKSQRRAAHRKKALKVGIPSLLALVLLIGGVFAATKFFGGKDAKDDAAARLDQVGNNDKTEEPEDDLRILLKDEEMEALYGNQKDQNIPTSSMGMMADLRIFLNSKAANEKMEDGVNIPVDMEQTVVDAKRATITSQTELQEALEAILADDMERIAAMPLADQGVEVERLLKKNLMDPKNGDMLNQALLEYPTFAEQNPWSVEFDEQVEEAMAREEDGKRPVGFWAFVQYANADAKKAQDLSQLRMSTKEDEATGMHNYWKTYCHLVASLEQLFTFEGAQTLESTENWHMSDMADWANTRIVKADYQEDKPAYIFVHRNKMGKITMKIGFNLADGRVELFEKKATPIPEDPKPKDKPDPDPDPDPDKYPATLIHYDVETGATLDTEGLGNFEVGVTVTGNSKSIANYTAMKDSVSGEMVKGGLTLRIPYKKNGTDPKVYPATLVHYDVDTGKTMATEDLGDYAIGVKVTGDAKAFAGYTVATTAPVSGNMKEGGITLKIGYKKTPDPKTYPATLIHYDVDTGVTLDTENLGSFEVGITVTGNAKSFANYTVATKAPVSDSMKEGGLTLRIGYKKNDPPVAKKYPATLIHYDKESGATLRTDSLGDFEVGTTVTGRADSFTGYTADISSTSGVMVEGGLTLRIPYTPKHDGDGQKDPEADPENKPGYDPGIGDNDPDDGKGDDQEEKPDEVDKENGPTENPDENRNDDGKDPTKPATPPITEDADEITVVDPDGSTSDVEKEPENTDKVNDSDPVQYGGAAVEAAPAVQAEPVQQEVATEVEAVEPVQEKKEAPAPEPVVVEAPAPAPAEQKAEPAEEAPAQESEADGAGEFQEDCP